MSFFYAEAKKEGRAKAPPKLRLQDIPIVTIRQMGCRACPRDTNTELRTPKMRPEGGKDARVYLLGTSPSREDDEDDVHWADRSTSEIYGKFGKRFMREQVRSNYITQCRGEENQIAVECCRARIVADIEETKPALIVTIGDAPLQWALGMDGSEGQAPKRRGALYVTKIGRHACWVFPIIYPNYATKSYKSGAAMVGSSFELTLDHDTKWVRDNFHRLPPAKVYEAPYDRGIEYIYGDQPGDIQRLERVLLDEIAPRPHALDIETNGLRPRMLRDPMILTAAAGTFERTLAFPLDIFSGWPTETLRRRAWEIYGEYLRRSARKTCHHAGFEMEWHEYFFGTEICRRTEWDDTMLMAHTLDERGGSHSLDAQTRKEFGFFLKDQSPVDVRREKWWTLYSLREILRYNGMDTKWTDLLREVKLRQIAEADARSEKATYLYEEINRLTPTLIMTEAPGLVVDFDYVEKLDLEMAANMKEIARKIARCDEIRAYERKHGEFSPTNPEHVLKLMKGLDRDEVRREDRRSGSVTWTTDEEALSAIPAREVPSAPLILEHREVSKLHGTYVEPAKRRKWVSREGRIHSKYSSTRAVSGRLASEDPNVQNFPKRKHIYVRGMIVPAHDFLVPCDYGQIEFRVVGMASRDKNLVKYCWTGYDVHKYWAQRMIAEYGRIVDWICEEFGDTLAELKAKAKKDGKDFDEDAAILKLLRQESKNKWVFPQLFGSATSSCASNLHLPEDVAGELGGEFWDEFRGVKEWQEELKEFYRRHLYVETLCGRRRRGAITMNELINHPIQGTAAEIVKAAQCALSELADAEGDPQLQPVLNVHDDLTFDLTAQGIDSRVRTIVREMCKPRFDFINVPLVVEVSKGTRWDNAEEIGVYRSHEVFGTPNPYEERR